MRKGKFMSNVLEPTDSEGRLASFVKGDKIFVMPAKMKATVIRQILHHDMGETFWGNLEVEYEDGIRGICHSWQVTVTD